MRIERLKKYEYWPYPVFYFPMFFYGFYLAIRARSLTYFTTVNPSMKYGGVMGESKKKVLEGIPDKYLPKTILVEEVFDFDKVRSEMAMVEIGFPLIAKPDVGERGSLIEKIENDQALKEYLLQAQERVLIQEYVDFPIELGVLYHKKPGADKGQISSIVRKEYLQVTGDGKKTLKMLLEKEVRAFGRMEYFGKKFGSGLNQVLGEGEEKVLEPIGNHCRGTTFLNGNELITPELNRVFDRITHNIEGFFYGRFDLKVKSMDDLYKGENIRVLELNGVSSEPAHVYDPDYSLIWAYRDIAWHMKIIFQIADLNYKSGHERASFTAFLKDIRKHFKRNRRRKRLS